ncbi:MAG: T9SS type A sorting domain-containing protein, partial [Phaeodactylibacter sp.]|nr:T9SS type A sorting domain-containing protein [Phaeodactylibacter sp.]
DENSDGYPDDLIVYQGKLYFAAEDENNGVELWRYDSGTETAELVKDIMPGSDSGAPTELFEFDNRLFFQAFTPTNGRQLVAYDATTDEIEIFPVGSGNATISFFEDYHGKLYFQCMVDNQGRELFRYDPETDETEMVYEWIPGGQGGSPTYLVAYNDHLYFQATEDTYGTELWEYHDTLAAPHIYADIWPNEPGSDPSYLTLFNGKLYFAADNGEKGSEIWSLAPCLNLFVTTNPENNNQSDGSIDLTIEGGTPPYQISWNTGASMEDINGLAAGDYTVTVTDALGCIANLTATVSMLVDAPGVANGKKLDILPNPNDGFFKLQVSGIAEPSMLRIYNEYGQQVWQSQMDWVAGERTVDVRHLPAGWYWLEIQGEEDVYIEKFLYLR